MAEARHIPLRLPLLYGGMSSQPPHVRHPSQVEDAQNFSFSVAHGATKRPGSQYLATINDLPNALGSGSTNPAADGTAPATCTPGDHASGYTVTYTLTGTDPDGTAISHVGQTISTGQHAGLCEWTGFGTAISNLTPYALLILETTERVWALGMLFVPSVEQPVALEGQSLGPSGADPDLATYPNITGIGNSDTYSLSVTTISIA